MDNSTPLGQQQAEPAASSAKFTFDQLTRLLLKISADFCEVDLFNDQLLRLSERPANTTTTTTTTTLARPREDAKRRPRWVLIVRGLYFYTTARILIYICLQYMYDFDWYEYESLRKKSALQAASMANNIHDRNTTTTTTDSNGPNLLRLLEQRIERDTWRLELVGAPFIKFHFGVELVYLYLTWAVFVLYLRPQLYFRRVRPFDVSLLRAVVDLQRERPNCDETVRCEVEKFCISARNFARSHQPNLCSARRASLAVDFESDQHLALERMALDGSLRPLNRSSAWIKRTSHLMGYCCLCLLSSLVILIASVFIYLPQSQLLEMSGIETGPMDLLFTVETIVSLAIAGAGFNFYLTVTSFNTLDQIRTTNKLHSLIECCICSNTHTFGRIEASVASGELAASFSPPCGRSASLMDTTTETTSPNRLAQQQPKLADPRDVASQYFAQMNSNLLFVVMSYKIFVSQTKSTRSFNAFFMLLIAELMIVGPVIGLISAQYLTTGMLYTIVCCCLCIIVWGDLSLAPCCYIYSCHLRTYRALHSLLAHTVALRCAVASTIDIYDSHTILILRKELSEPHLMLEQFATTPLGFQFNMTNLFKIHFWCGIIAILGYYAASGPNKGSVFEATIRFF